MITMGTHDHPWSLMISDLHSHGNCVPYVTYPILMCTGNHCKHVKNSVLNQAIYILREREEDIERERERAVGEREEEIGEMRKFEIGQREREREILYE